MNDSNSVPSAKLAESVVERLISAGLVRKENRMLVIQKISLGEMKGEDWRLEIELATVKAPSQ